MNTQVESLPVSAPALETPQGPQAFPTWSVGDCTAQGDLYLIGIHKPKSLKPRANRQLAEGETRGSRHVCTRGDVFDGNASELVDLIHKATGKEIAEKYVGPVMSPGAYLDHPQHQHKDFSGDCYTAVVYQRNLDAEEREILARD